MSTQNARIVSIFSKKLFFFIFFNSRSETLCLLPACTAVPLSPPTLPISSPEVAASSLPFPTVESPASEYAPSAWAPLPPALEILVLGSSPSLIPFPTGTSTLTPPSVDSSSSAEGNGLGQIQGLVFGLCCSLVLMED
ncbi:hypothetical protein LINGRAHAP2_LOCUS7596 [Linum grandiflorum]